MKRSAIAIVVALFFAGAAAAQSGSEPVQNTSATRADEPTTLPAGAPIDATLTKSLDSHKLKPGDSVTAETTESTEDNGKTIIPRGTKLEGHVVQASARSKGDTYSSLGIVFDKAVLKHGEQIPLNVTVQAIAAPVNAAPQPDNSNMGNMAATSPSQVPGDNSPNRSMAGVPPQGAGVPPTGMAPTANPNAAANTNVGNAIDGTGAVGGTNSSGRLTANSRGVFGLKGIGLTGSTTRSQEPASVITSTGKNVHLDSGTQLLLVTQTPTTAPKS